MPLIVTTLSGFKRSSAVATVCPGRTSFPAGMVTPTTRARAETYVARLDDCLVDHRPGADPGRHGRRPIGADRAGPEHLRTVADRHLIPDLNHGSGCRMRVQRIGHDRGIVQDHRAEADLDGASVGIQG